MTAHHYAAYGLHIVSDLDLPLRTADPSVPDVEVSASDPQALSTTPLEAHGPNVIASTLVPNTSYYWYVVTDEDTQYRVRVRDLGEFTIDRALRSITWATFEPAGLTLAGVIIAGTMLSLLLTLRGDPLLHASAVAIGGRTVAFTGQSGRGKSTVAALCAAAGAAVVTDDLLRIRMGSDGLEAIRCRGNAGELRLRPRVWKLAERFGSDATQRSTGDSRLGLLPSMTESGWTELRAIVVPTPDRERTELTWRRLQPTEAMLALLSFPRVAGLQSGELHAQQFSWIAELAGRVPLYEAAIPWGPPFQPTLGQQLLAILDSDTPD